ncbi:MAG: HAMP domain-containing sensor histidine kinase [Gammaproteobacteria bacterium]|nr:HAMP domain-containing sensor histidine kinase [Gammaproteobacteria bacterium]
MNDDPIGPSTVRHNPLRDTATGHTPKSDDVIERVFCEQLRMPMRAMQWALYPGLLLLALLFFALHTLCPGSTWQIDSWCGIAAATWLAEMIHGRLELKHPPDPAKSRRLLRESRLVYGIEGVVWGCLPWVTLDRCTTVGDILIIVAGAGVAASRMMLLVSLPSVFGLYILVGGMFWTAKAWDFGDMPFHALGLLGAFYVITLLFQANVYSRALIDAIRLRFENKKLLARLSAEMQISEAARCRAESANAAKSKFLAATSHDLRQPAQAQELFLEVLSKTALDKTQRALVDNIRKTFSSSIEMLNTLLDFSRIDAGTLAAQQRDFALRPLLLELASEYAPQARAHNLTYRCRCPDVIAHSDPALLARILRNLVSNAIRYTEHGGVLVASRKRHGFVLVEVWDTGKGIEPQYQKAIFEEFRQLGNPERDQKKGLGLGLAIVDRLARILGHELTMASHLGRGSVFRLALPMGAYAEGGARCHTGDSRPG